MSGLSNLLYTNSPVWLQNIGISLYGLNWRQRRYGGNFLRYVEDFVKRENFLAEEWLRYQTEQLRSLLLNSNRNVPYYSMLFSKLGLTDQDLVNFRLEDMSTLPILEKEQIRAQPELFIAQNIRVNRLNKYHTSGTTGTPLVIKSTNETDRKVQAAYEARVRKWAGLNYKMSRAMIGGRLVVPQGTATPPFWRFNIVERQLYMSAFHISPANAPDYVSAMNRYRPDYLVGYASAHFFLARIIDEGGLEVHKPKAVLTSSEKLTDEMRHQIEKVYCCEVFDGYSGVENCCLASECEHHHMHVSPDVGVIEVINEREQPAKPGEAGEIVATGFLNFEQPLIRFRTGDLTVLSNQPCHCGRSMPIMDQIVGRLEDTVIGQDGRETVRFHGIFVGLPNVREGQIIQDTIKDFRVKLVVDTDLTTSERDIIRKRFGERLGSVNVSFELVDQIERTERGKFRAVISHVVRNQDK